MLSTCQYITANFKKILLISHKYIQYQYIFTMNIGIKLKRLSNENFIWLIYFFIIIAALLSNAYEKYFLETHDYHKEKIYKTLNITIFCVAFFIYLYFVVISYEDVESLKKTSTKKEVVQAHVQLIASILFLVAGGLALYNEINRESPDTDIGVV